MGNTSFCHVSLIKVRAAKYAPKAPERACTIPLASSAPRTPYAAGTSVAKTIRTSRSKAEKRTFILKVGKNNSRVITASKPEYVAEGSSSPGLMKLTLSVLATHNWTPTVSPWNPYNPNIDAACELFWRSWKIAVRICAKPPRKIIDDAKNPLVTTPGVEEILITAAMRAAIVKPSSPRGVESPSLKGRPRDKLPGVRIAAAERES